MKNRNRFERGALALVLCITMTLAACSTTWIGQAEEVVAVLIPAATNILTLVATLQGTSISAVDLQTIQNAGTQAGADLQLIQSLITAYENADATTKVGILNQIQTAIGTVQTNLQAVLPALHIQDTATQVKITAVVGIVLSEVQSLAAIVPLLSPTTSKMMIAKAAVQTKKQSPLTAEEFVKSYNATLTAKTGNPELDRVTSALQIHQHGKMARVTTAGMLK